MTNKRLWDKGKSLDKEIHAFTIGNDPIIDKEILPWDILASSAHAIMLSEQNLLSKSDLKNLLPALKSAYSIARNGQFEIPAELEDCHTALESYLVEQCGDAGKKIHLGRSRNDQVLVATRLYLRHITLTHTKELLNLASSCHTRAINTLSLQMPGHTHFQQAMPASVGMWFAAIMEGTLELAEEGLGLNILINKNPLGVGSGFGTPITINRDRTTELLNFKCTQRNPINTQNSRGKYESKVLRLFSDTAGIIEKYAFDLILYSMQELGFVTLPDAYTTGSSIMPQKKNPDVLELLRGNASIIRAKQIETELLTSKLPSHYHRDFQLTKEPVITSYNLISLMLKIFKSVIDKVEFNEEVLKKAKTPELYATYEAFRLVKEGLPFRDAYHKTAEKLEKNMIDVESLANDFNFIAESLRNESTMATEKIQKSLDKVNAETLLLTDLENILFSY